MIRNWGVCRIVVRIVVGIMLAGFVPRSGIAQEAKAQPPPLTMEELEVRGFREKPGQLYISFPNPVFTPAPVRFDLLRDDIARGILPWEISEGNTDREDRKTR